MIKFKKISNEVPYKVFKINYEKALKNKQKNIEAICISSYSKRTNEVNARFVNLKLIQDKKFIFFSNYNSLKAQDFCNHNQITALIYWQNINVQIRMKATIEKTSQEFNQSYFEERDKKKNALSISSNQSSYIKSYEDVQSNYKKCLESKDLLKCPKYWGGYFFVPFYFEFWQGHASRINKREIYELKDNEWMKGYLQP